jgi:hypothetical protein
MQFHVHNTRLRAIKAVILLDIKLQPLFAQ